MATIDSISVRDCLVSYGAHEWIVEAVDDQTLYLVNRDGEQLAIWHGEIVNDDAGGWRNLGPNAFDWR